MKKFKTLALLILSSMMLVACAGGDPSSQSSSGTPSGSNPSSQESKSSTSQREIEGELILAEKLKVYEGQSANISAEFEPEDEEEEYDDIPFEWSVEDEDVASIQPFESSCKVTGVSVGKTTLTVKFAQHTAECAITVEEQKGPEPTAVTTYLVLTKIGLYNGEPGEDIPEYCLEYAVTYESYVGEALPGKDEITTVDSSKGIFSCWVAYEKDGKPTTYTTVPTEDNKILYAFFEEGEKPDPGPTPPTPGTEVTFYMTNNYGWNEEAGIYLYGFNETDHMQWPGVKMEKVDENEYKEAIYAATISSDYTHIIFSGRDFGNTKDVQTVDIPVSDFGENNAVWMQGNQDENPKGLTVGFWTYIPLA